MSVRSERNYGTIGFEHIQLCHRNETNQFTLKKEGKKFSTCYKKSADGLVQYLIP